MEDTTLVFCLRNLKNSDTLYQWRRAYVRENKKGLCPTLTANMGTGGHNVPLIRDKKDIRKLTPRECLRFQGFPETYQLPADLPRTALYKQAGNSVSIPVVEKIAANIQHALQACQIDESRYDKLILHLSKKPYHNKQPKVACL